MSPQFLFEILLNIESNLQKNNSTLSLRPLKNQFNDFLLSISTYYLILGHYLGEKSVGCGYSDSNILVHRVNDLLELSMYLSCVAWVAQAHIFFRMGKELYPIPTGKECAYPYKGSNHSIPIGMELSHSIPIEILLLQE